MHRVVFCPQEQPVEDAYDMAKEWGLSIQHGDSERTESMDFDRSQIQVLSIPIQRGFDAELIECLVNAAMSIKYSNDWDNVSEYKFLLRPKGMRAGKKTHWDVPSMLMDNHRAVMNLSVTYPGYYELVSVKDGIDREITEIIAMEAQGVYPGD